jgi:hypothetical protein
MFAIPAKAGMAVFTALFRKFLRLAAKRLKALGP